MPIRQKIRFQRFHLIRLTYNHLLRRHQSLHQFQNLLLLHHHQYLFLRLFRLPPFLQPRRHQILRFQLWRFRQMFLLHLLQPLQLTFL